MVEEGEMIESVMLSEGEERQQVDKKVLTLLNAMEKSGLSVINFNTIPVTLDDGSFSIIYRVDFQVNDTIREAPQNIDELYQLLKSLDEDCQR